MSVDRTASSRSAFSLIEIMVVIAIIGLLVAALLPAFGTVRLKARYAQANAHYTALHTGLEMVRGESDLGGGFPPSASDNDDDRQIIANPKRVTGGNGGSPDVRIAGAHLLAQAMFGADGLGTPGFRDVNRDGLWWDNTHDEEDDGIYYIDPTDGKERYTRYGGSGYVDDKMKDRAVSLTDLEEKGVILNLSHPKNADFARDELLFVDPWDMPILYYKANTASLRMTGNAENSGIYWQEDNGIITGTEQGITVHAGLDFGSGKMNGRYHAIAVAMSPDPITPIDEVLTDDPYVDSFARFILDPSIMARRAPVRKDSYLLISAGPDGRYGTDDDVTNWTKDKD